MPSVDKFRKPPVKPDLGEKFLHNPFRVKKEPQSEDKFRKKNEPAR